MRITVAVLSLLCLVGCAGTLTGPEVEGEEGAASTDSRDVAVAVALALQRVQEDAEVVALRSEALSGQDMSRFWCAEDALLFPDLAKFHDSANPIPFSFDEVAAEVDPAMLIVLDPQQIPAADEDWSDFIESIGTSRVHVIHGPHIVSDGRLGLYLTSYHSHGEYLQHGGGYWFRWTASGWRIDGRFCGWSA